MKFFEQLAAGVDVIPLRHAIQIHPELWNAHRLRTTHEGSPHREVDDIWLRFQDLEPYQGEQALHAAMLDEHECQDYPALNVLPQARVLMYDLLRRVEGSRIGRVLITRLGPGKRIYPHRDMGAHASYYERHHLVLQGGPGVIFRAGDEEVQMRTGELWWFQNSVEHEVINNSHDDRIHLILDIHHG